MSFANYLKRGDRSRVWNGLVGHYVGLHLEVAAARGNLADDHLEEVRRHRHIILPYDLRPPNGNGIRSGSLRAKKREARYIN